MAATPRHAADHASASAAAPSAIILAAGMGKRMQSDLPKVLHPVGDPQRPMVQAVIDACREAGCTRIVLVVGYKQELVRDAVKGQTRSEGGDVEFAVQADQLGTGHAVRCAAELYAAASSAHDVFVLAGDGPLIRAQTLRQLLDRHRSTAAKATLATSRIPDPAGYGRILRNVRGGFEAIVEHKDCSPEQLRINEVNPSYYCFNARAMFDSLERVKRNPSSNEYYLTDVPALLLSGGDRVEVIDAVPPEDILSINTPEQLAEVDKIYRARARSSQAASATAAGKGAAR